MPARIGSLVWTSSPASESLRTISAKVLFLFVSDTCSPVSSLHLLQLRIVSRRPEHDSGGAPSSIAFWISISSSRGIHTVRFAESVFCLLEPLAASTAFLVHLLRHVCACHAAARSAILLSCSHWRW